jgi:tetratricopeptide (TPR) repeat protein
MIAPSGDIKGMIVPWLLQDLRIEKKTGTAVFSRDTEERKVYFRDGDVLFASSNLNDDRLGEFLLRKGKITQAQFEKSSEVVIKTGKKLGAVLFEMGALTSVDLVTQVKLQVREIVLHVFSWRDGRYTFDDRPLPLSEIIPLHISTGDLITAGIRDLDWKIVRKALPPLTTIIRPVSDPSLLFQSASLDQDQRTVFSLINGNKSIEQLCSLTGIGDFNTLKAIYVLLALRMTEPGEIKTDEKDKFAPATATAEKEPEQAESTATVASVTREMIQHTYESLEIQNYYEILGVGRTATPQEIKKAYFHHAKLYHPDRHFDPGMNDMKEKLEALFARIHDAYETLSSKTRRDKYNLDLISGATHQSTEERAEQKKTDNKGAAAVQFQEGLKQFKMGNFWGADEAFQWALRLDPDNAEYTFQRGLTLARIPRRGHEAEEYYRQAIKLAPKKVDYYLALGSFYEKSGLKAKALTVYQDALKYDPQSEKLIQAIEKAGK